ncbi:glycoside hydrolase family 10 protein [Nubsella zeaxanthinifaciens]|uniref:glycoside hydrolase family 10 protein n=1 Tax=Nubsella zeaxanthinifaciens TaxID=392412 RepID=UPI000DE33CC9|nr:family 10 glycosylhydrolase [Nubsella zeaxanthinifaciens]
MFKKLLLVLFICSSFIAQSQIVNQPKIQREFRAAWIASVANINWPSKPGLTTQQQQDEAIALLDMLQKNNFNAVIFQIRPQADAFYKSDIEPWSYYLTGVQGQAPNPYYDPLEFWVNAAHERGMELHVWLNPYRAHHIAGGEVSEFSVVKKHPDLVVKLKQGYWWFDPSKKGTQDLASSVVKDIVKRYDIDGVHFDDYFYPYAEYNGGDDFPDEESYANYQKDGGKLSRGDWRREQVNKFVKRVYSEIKKEKKHVKFGISPFGIWRPGYPESIKGMDQYEKLYADAKLWLNKGWIDYFMPQLYWQINNIPLSFPVLLGWWQTENTKNRHLWPGLNSGIGGGEKNSDEIINQIMIARGIVPNSPGVAHWSIGALTKHESLRNDLLAGPYKEEALIPTSPWLDKKAPAAVSVDKEDRNTDLYIKWTAKDEKDVFKYVVYTQYGDRWTYRTLNSKSSFFQVPKVAEVNAKTKATAPLKAIKVTAVDRTGNESEGEVIAL